MSEGSTGLNGSSVVPSTSETHSTGNNLQLVPLNGFDADINRVNDAIKDILENLGGGYSYKGPARFVADFEKRLNTKKGEDRIKELGALKVWLIMGKEFIGSEICSILEVTLKQQGKEFKERYPLTDEQIKVLVDEISYNTLQDTGVILSKKKVLDIETQGSVVFDRKKRIPKTPEVLSTNWPEKRGTIPELHVLLNLINLVILKIELLCTRGVIELMMICKMQVGDITMTTKE